MRKKSCPNKKQHRRRYPHAAGAAFEVVFLMEKKSKSTVWLNHGFIIAGQQRFVKRIFVLENMRTCIV
jgi:hypothetical protein